MSVYRWRSGVVALMAMLAACAQKSGGSGDSTRGDTVTAAGAAAPAAPDTVAPVVGSSEKRPTAKAVGDVSRAPSAGDARITGGPGRKPTPPRSSGCGGTFVNVTVKASALSGSTLAQVASDVLAPVRADVGAPSLSPAIRAFRVAVRDPLDVDRVVTRLRASPKVAAVESDGCEKMIERER